MRRWLDRLYAFTGGLAAAATLLIMVVIFVQVGGRLLGFGVRGADDVVAWLTASASLAGMGYAFSRSCHVRVELLLERLAGQPRKALEVASLAIALAISGFAAYSCFLMVADSFRMNELSQGDYPVALWIPQSGVAIGALTLAVAVADALFQKLTGRVAGKVGKSALSEI